MLSQVSRCDKGAGVDEAFDVVEVEHSGILRSTAEIGHEARQRLAAENRMKFRDKCMASGPTSAYTNQ